MTQVNLSQELSEYINLYNDAPLNKSPKKNWVEKKGGLPGPVRARARALKKKHPEWTLSHCIAVAINAVKYSAATGDTKLPGRQNEKASTVAKHGAAAAKWAAMKLSNPGGEDINLAKKDEDSKGKEGSKSGGVKSSNDLAKAKAAYQRKKKSMSPEKRKKVEARLKSSQQRLGHKVGLSNVDMALGGRPFDQGKHPRAVGGRFGSTGGVKSAGASNNSATKQDPQDFHSLVKKLKLGQSITLPKSNVKVKKVDAGYQLFDGKTNIVVKTADSAISQAQGLARSGKGGKTTDDNSSNTTK